MPVQYCFKLLHSHLSTSTFLKPNSTPSIHLNSHLPFSPSQCVLVLKNQVSYCDDRTSTAIWLYIFHRFRQSLHKIGGLWSSTLQYATADSFCSLQFVTFHNQHPVSTTCRTRSRVSVVKWTNTKTLKKNFPHSFLQISRVWLVANWTFVVSKCLETKTEKLIGKFEIMEEGGLRYLLIWQQLDTQ